MGMAASQARFLGLTARKNDVEFRGQQVNQRRTQLSNESAELLQQLLEMDTPVPPSLYQPVDASDPNSAITLLDHDSDAYQALYAQYEVDLAYYNAEYDRVNNRMLSIQESDKKLEIQLTQLDTEQQAISTEIDAVKKVIDKNVELTFKTFA